jgi:hypothetical protein
VEEKRAWLSILVFARFAGEITHQQRMEFFLLVGPRGLGIEWRLSYKANLATTERGDTATALPATSAKPGSLTFDDRSTVPEHT